MRKEKMRSAIVCWAAAVILMCYLVQVTDCLRLKKTEKRATQKENGAATSIGVQEGKIVFGKVFRKRSQVVDKTTKSSTNASVEDETAYQADSAGWSNPDMEDAAAKDKWNRLATSLHCFGDHMKFRSLGQGASELAVEQADSVQPLSMVPRNCGYNMHGNSMDGNYMLPLQWHGNPVSLMCPDHTTPAAPKSPVQWLHKYLWPHKHQWSHKPQDPQSHAASQGRHMHFVPQGNQNPNVYTVPRDSQGYPVPQDSQGYPVPREPQGYLVPQDSQGYPVPREPQSYPAPQEPQSYPVPQEPQGYPAPQATQEPRVPPVQQEPQVHALPQEPQVHMVPLPDKSFFSNPLLYRILSAAAEQAHVSKFPKYPPYSQQFYSFVPPAAQQTTTAVPNVMTHPQMPYYPHFAWPFGPHFPNVPVPQMQTSWVSVPEMKPPAAPSTGIQSPADMSHLYPPAHVPFLPYNYLYMQQMPHHLPG
ncbi:uncharacterized protein ACNS7B_019846 isoform 2-T2 [Menidia menidia]